MTKYTKKGFSLIEIIASCTILGIVTSSLIGTILVLQSAKNNIATNSRLQHELQFATDRLGNLIRDFSINYAAYENNICSTSDTSKLCLGGNNTISTAGQNLLLNTEPLFSQKTIVNKAQFSIFPNKNPAKNLANKELQYQPSVQIILEIASRYNPQNNYKINTTYSSRKYE